MASRSGSASSSSSVKKSSASDPLLSLLQSETRGKDESLDLIGSDLTDPFISALMQVNHEQEEPLLSEIREQNNLQWKDKEHGVENAEEDLDDPYVRYQQRLRSDLQSKRGRCGGKCSLRGFVWCFVIFLAVFGLCGVLGWFVVVPKIAQNKVNSAQISVKQIQLQRLRNESMWIQMDIDVIPASIMYPVSLPSVPVTVYFASMEIGKMSMPDLKIPAHATKLEISHSTAFQITQKENFIRFNREMIRGDSFTWEMRGPATLSINDTPLGTLRIPVDFINKVSSKGMQGLNNLTVDHFELIGNHNWEPDQTKENGLQGIRMTSEATLFNPSILSIQMGDVSFSLSYAVGDDWIPIGLMTVLNQTLVPGVNSLNLEGLLLNPKSFEFENQVTTNDQRMDALEKLMNRFVRGLPVEMRVQGYAAKDLLEFNVHPPMDVVDWLHQSLNVVDSKVSLEPKDKLVVESVDLKYMQLKIRNGIPFAPVLRGEVEARLRLPIPVDVQIDAVQHHLNLFLCDDMDCLQKKRIGEIESNQWDMANIINSEPDGEGKIMSVFANLNKDKSGGSSDKFVLGIPNDRREAYQKMFYDLLSKTKVALFLEGFLYSQVTTAVGSLKLYDTKIAHRVVCDGLSSMRNHNAVRLLGNLEVPAVSKDGMTIIHNHGFMRWETKQIGLLLEHPLLFSLIYLSEKSETDVGRVQVPSLVLSSRYASCAKKQTHPVLGRPVHFDALYCPTLVQGQLSLPMQSMDEYCNNCTVRDFLSGYLSSYPANKSDTQMRLEAIDGPEDMRLAFSLLKIPLALPSYQPNPEKTKEPFPLLRRITIKPTLSQLRAGRLSCWLDFYNPFDITIRFYYFHVDTMFQNVLFGTLWHNLTRVDPFLNYRQSEPGALGPGTQDHRPSEYCVKQHDCQIAPFDLQTEESLPSGSGPESKLQRTRRLEVTFDVSVPAVKTFWESLIRSRANISVEVKGQVLVGMGVAPWNQVRNDTSEPSNDDRRLQRDPYWFPPKKSDDILFRWLEFGQSNTELVLLRPEIGEI